MGYCWLITELREEGRRVAADVIEQQEAELAQLRATLDKLRSNTVIDQTLADIANVPEPVRSQVFAGNLTTRLVQRLEQKVG